MRFAPCKGHARAARLTGSHLPALRGAYSRIKNGWWHKRCNMQTACQGFAGNLLTCSGVRSGPSRLGIFNAICNNRAKPTS